MFAVANYGHYWKRERVDFGSRGKKSSLLGYFGPQRDRRVVDFKDQIGIYVLYDEWREVVYIGQAGSGTQRLLSRLRAHTRDHLRDRWAYFSWLGLRQHTQTGALSEKQKPESKFSGSNSDALNELEAVLIQLFEPRLNKRGSNWKDTQEFLQWDQDVETLDEDEE